MEEYRDNTVRSSIHFIIILTGSAGLIKSSYIDIVKLTIKGLGKGEYLITFVIDCKGRGLR